MWAKLQQLLDRTESRIALWQVIQGSSLIGTGVLSGWLSGSVAWIDRFGAFGWWVAFLLGCLLAAIFLLLWSMAKGRLALARAVDRWGQPDSGINPIDREFNGKRISLAEFAHPVTRRIEGKRFTNCDFVGLVALVYVRDTTSVECDFGACDFIVARNGANIHNVVQLIGCSFVGCRFYNAIIYIHPAEIRPWVEMGTPFLTLTGIPEVDQAADRVQV